MATQSFPLFSRLPTEIKLMIWEHTIEPRYVYLEMRWDIAGNMEFSGRPDYRRDIDAIPTILQINRESRNTFLPQYPALFKGKYKNRRTRTEPDHGGTRINLAVDIVVFDGPRFELFQMLTLYALEEDWAQIRCISVSQDIWTRIYDQLRWFDFPSGLETLLVVQHPNDELLKIFWTEWLEGTIKGVECQLKNKDPAWKAKIHLIEEEILNDRILHGTI